MKVFCERCGNAHAESICCKESYVDLPEAGAKLSAYAQLSDVRAASEELFKTLKMDYGTFSSKNGVYEKEMRDYPLSDAVITAIIEWYNKVSEHF